MGAEWIQLARKITLYDAHCTRHGALVWKGVSQEPPGASVALFARDIAPTGAAAAGHVLAAQQQPLGLHVFPAPTSLTRRVGVCVWGGAVVEDYWRTREPKRKQTSATVALKKPSNGFALLEAEMDRIHGFERKLGHTLRTPLLLELETQARRADAVWNIFSFSHETFKSNRDLAKLAHLTDFKLHCAGNRMRRVRLHLHRLFVERQDANEPRKSVFRRDGDAQVQGSRETSRLAEESLWFEMKEREEISAMVCELHFLAHVMLFKIAATDVKDDSMSLNRDDKMATPFFGVVDEMVEYAKDYFERSANYGRARAAIMLFFEDLSWRSFLSALIYASDAIRLCLKHNHHLDSLSKGLMSRLLQHGHGAHGGSIVDSDTELVVLAAGGDAGSASSPQQSARHEHRGAAADEASHRSVPRLPLGGIARLNEEKTLATLLSDIKEVWALGKSVGGAPSALSDNGEAAFREFTRMISSTSRMLKREVEDMTKRDAMLNPLSDLSSTTTKYMRDRLARRKDDFSDLLLAIKDHEQATADSQKKRRNEIIADASDMLDPRVIFREDEPESKVSIPPWRQAGIADLEPFGLMAMEDVGTFIEVDVTNCTYRVKNMGTRKMRMYETEMSRFVSEGAVWGKITKPAPITIDRELLHLGQRLKSFCWLYPLQGLDDEMADNMTKLFGNSQDAFLELDRYDYLLINGGYLYWTTSTVSPKSPPPHHCLSLYAQGTDLLFSEPRKLPEKWSNPRDFGTITIRPLRQALGAQFFRWLSPEEVKELLEGQERSDEGGNHLGAFAYLYENPERNNYFLLRNPAG